MKTKNRSDGGIAVILVALPPLIVERIRASLRRGPFHFTSAPVPDEDADLAVIPVESLPALCPHGVPVIACGPAEMLRTAFLSGCVDYLKDPWQPEELAVRAQAAIARAEQIHRFPWGAVSISDHQVRLPQGSAPLTRGEALILRALLRARGQPVSREALAALVGSPRAASGSRSVDVQIAAIRRKVRAAAPAAGRLIVSARGRGYMVP